MTIRRNFIKQLFALGALSNLPHLILSSRETSNKKLIWAYLVHLSYNMSCDHDHKVWNDLPADYYSDVNFEIKTCDDAKRWASVYRPFLTFDYKTWDTILNLMTEAGMNMVVINLGDAVKYRSHPEIAVENAWSTSKLRKELSRIREMGLEPIPKLNFSTTHDIWLGKYSRMVSTEKYYTVCRNLIREVIDLFDKPRFFHLGMDEENYDADSQARRQFLYDVFRHGDLWWHDLYYLVEEVEKHGSRAWIWSDYGWRHPEEFFAKMPKSVVQSNWYYGARFEPDIKPIPKFYIDLDEHGYDQIPTGSNHMLSENFGLTVDFCTKVIDPNCLLGFISAPWRPTLPACTDFHKESIDQVASAIKKFEAS